jgi:hypothetical protein
MVDISAAITGLTYLRDFTKYVYGLQKDAEVLVRTNAAAEKVAEVHDKLQELRAENLNLQEQNRVLAEKLRAADDWKARRDQYRLVKAPGGATVLSHDGSARDVAHHACPACEQKQRVLVPLQDRGVANGVHDCPSCGTAYAVDTVQQRWS